MMLAAARLVLAASLFIAVAAGAQSPGSAGHPLASYSTKPLRWVVPYPAGASNDVIARTVGSGSATMAFPLSA